ncbi:MAG TPA: HAMP domain-containing sensor histidine kinase [Longimicrobiales bacterium]|nr:HAMP domain-containing sensor histidine kinase [Longimicrobiales bacterium]
MRSGSVRSLAELRAAGRPLTRPAVLYAALGAVLLSLLALILVPALVQRQMDQVHEDLDHAVDPAARHVEELRYYVARQMAAARGFVLTGDSTMLAGLQAMRDSATRGALRFPQEARRLSPAVAEDIGAAAAYVDAWHSQFVPGTLTPVATPYPTQSFGLGAYRDALAGLDSLRASLGVSAGERRARVRRLERLQIQTTVGLGLLALISAGLVAWLVSRVRRLAAEAARQRAQGLRAARTRDQLIRGVSHDLKNPLGVIQGYAELLQMGLKGPVSEEQQQTLQRIRVTVSAALATVSELVDMSSAQAGLLRVEREPVSIGPLLRELFADYQSVAETAGLSLQLEALPDLPRVYADRRRVRQILENLLGNAVKYTGRGGLITISAEQRERPAERVQSWLAMHVEDTGPGIPADRLESVFEEFVRLENAAGTSGSGVGLAMARSLAGAMGGDVSVLSEVGVGSVFTLWLPLGRE